MQIIADPDDRVLLDDWQRDFPIRTRPFAKLAETLALDEDGVIARLKSMISTGRVTRVGATCAPNTVSASTLAAVAAPPDKVDEVAALIGAQVGVNHSYQRENTWNLWFVVTGPDRDFVNATLQEIGRATGLRVLDLRLVRPFNVDLGFRMGDAPRTLHLPRRADPAVLRKGDRRLLQRLTTGLPLTARPFAALGDQTGQTETAVMDRIAALLAAGIITRFGIIVRHRALGWSSNAMVVWKLDPDRVGDAGTALAALPGVTLCYERRPVEGVWPYRLYNMIHARSRAEARSVLDKARALPELAGAGHDTLFSNRCFKQTGALISLNTGQTA